MTLDSLGAVARLTDALSRATTLADVYDAALDALQRSLGVERASVLLFDAENVMSFVAWRGISDDYRRAVNGHTPWRPDSRDVQPISVEDVTRDAELAPYLPVFARENIRALGFYPLVYRDAVIGKFMLYFAEPHVPSAEEVALAQTIAGQIAFGVARVRAETALLEQRDRLNALVENVPGVVWEGVVENDGTLRITFVSDARFADAAVIEDILVAADNPEIRHRRVRMSDGSVIWTEERLQRSGNTVRGVTVDITARKAAERREAFLSEASQTLAASLDYAETLERVTQIAVRDFADWCVIDVVEGHDIRRVAASHRDPSRSATLQKAKAFTVAQQRSRTIRTVIETCQPVLIRIDWAEFTELYRDNEELLETFRELGLASYISVPLIARGECLGALTMISADTVHVYGNAELEVALELGRRAAYAVDNARLYRDAQDANRAKDEFLVTLSHELRTPMTATLGWAAMLHHELSPEQFRIAVETIERSTRAQANLVDDIMDVSRIVTGKLQLDPSPLNVRSILEAAVESIRPSANAKSLALNVTVPDTPVVAVADASRMQQVLANLLANAVKFTPAGGTIFVTLHPAEGPQVRITVRDTGIGIPPAFLPHVFDRFRQADSSSSRAHGGLGLGLAIVKSIVEMHGGSVTAESDGEGCGATFSVMLPVAGTSAAKGTSERIADPHQSLNGLAVLVVEDQDDTRDMLAAALRSFGARVTAVSSVDEAIASMHSNVPHVIVSDIAMPDRDGFALMLHLRDHEDERVRNLPAIALTAYAAPEDRQRILASGFTQHLAKPIDPVTVVETVRAAANRS